MDEKTARGLIHCNGIDGSTGSYWTPPRSPEELADTILANSSHTAGAQDPPTRPAPKGQTLGTKYGVDSQKLAQAGWGVVFAHDTDPAVREALRPLLDFRKSQAGETHPGRYRELFGGEGFQPEDTVDSFFTRHHCPIGAVDPDRLPYYLLLVGHPEQIPYEFQHHADVDYAVGRLSFENPKDYAAYADSVLAAESKEATGIARKKAFGRHRVTLFGVRNSDDPATAKSADYLITPLANALGNVVGAEIHTYLAAAANKRRLQSLFGGPDTPDLLFCAAHGMGFPKGENRQLRHQGALLCQDWPGPKSWQGPIPEDHYLSADDISDEADVAGLISFQFACFGGGTPRYDSFFQRAENPATELSAKPFTSRLAQRLLSHPRGGALAVVAHVDRCWGWSFLWPESGAQIGHFESALRMLLDGCTIGSALEGLNDRYASLATRMSEKITQIDFGKNYEPRDLSRLWTAVNDARGWVILGDPAVRLPSPQG